MRSATRSALVAAAFAAAPLAALADDPPPAPAAPPAAPPADGADKPTLDASAKFGWRLLSGEGEGRFPQDHGLRDGGRLFDLDLVARDPGGARPVDEIEARAAGIGDPWSDATLTLRKRGRFELSGGWRRDESDYRASGDPFPYDVVRERTFVHGAWTPLRDAAVRFAWDASDRRGHAFTDGYDYFSLASVGQRRSVSQESDRFSLGGDCAVGPVRFGLTQTFGTAHVDDSRVSDSPVAGDASRDVTRVETDSKTYATTAKLAATILEDVLDATLLVTRSRTPLDEETSGRASGATTPPTYAYAGGGRIVRHALDWRLETSWRPLADWEFVFAGESDDVVDEEDGLFTRGGTVERSPHARITDRSQRWSADATWDVSKTLRLRLGEQYLREELLVPTDSHFAVWREPFSGHRPTDLDSESLRTTAGADWTATKTLKLSALARISSNDRPQTTPIADRGDEYGLRARWDPAPEWSLRTLWRRQGLVHTGAVPRVDLYEAPDPARPGRRVDLDAAGRTTSVSQTVAWTHAPWTVSGSATYRRTATSADTAWGAKSTTRLHLQSVSFESRDLIASLDVRCDVTKKVHLSFAAARTGATGDFAARWSSATLGAAYDFTDDVTLGLSLSTWRLLDREVRADGYRVYGVETSVTWKFR